MKKKDFIKLQTEWYDKLKKEGFEDIEWFNPKTGLGQGSPFLKSKSIPDSGEIRAKYSQSLEKHYRLCRNFLANGPFYSVLKAKYLKLLENGALTSRNCSFKAYRTQQSQHYSRAEEAAWSLYCDGSTIRQISIALRRLHKQKKLGKPPKRWGKALKGLPYSIFWVKKIIDKLKAECIHWNHTDYEGIYVYEAEQADEGLEANKPIGGSI